MSETTQRAGYGGVRNTRGWQACSGTTRDGEPCRNPSTQTYHGMPCCIWHGDPMKRARRTLRARRWQWTDDNLEILFRLTERGATDAAIARRLRTSIDAVKAARYNYRLAPRAAITLDAATVSRIFGHVNSQSVRLWIKYGFLRARRSGMRGRHQCWFVSYDDLEAFMADERYWHLWSPEQVTRQTLVDDCGRPRHLRFYSVAQVADICGVSRTAPCKWCKKGWLQAVKYGTEYFIRSDWLEDFRAQWSYGDGIGRKESA